MVPGAAALLVLLAWSAALVWALSRGRWFLAPPLALLAVIATVMAAQAVGGRWPAFYGMLPGVSLFIAGAMMTMAALTAVMALLAGDRH